MEQISPELLETKFCSSMVGYIGFDCKPHKILYVDREELYDSYYIPALMVECCPMREPRTPRGLICGKIISNKKIEVQMDWKGEKKFYEDKPEKCVLSIVYEVTRESSDTAACEGSNPEKGARENDNRARPAFVCQLQFKETSAEQIPELACQSQPNEESSVSVVVRAPQVASVGSSYGVWVSMEVPHSMIRPKEEKINISDLSGESEQVESSIGEPKRKKRKILDSSEESEPIKRWSFVASVTVSNENVKLKECRGHLFRGGGFTRNFRGAGCTRKFREVVTEFSRPGFDSKNLCLASEFPPAVKGPIKKMNCCSIWI